MTDHNERISARLPFRVPDGDIPGIIADCRENSSMGIQVTITLPESVSGGEWLTRPHSVGGPDVFVYLSVPIIHGKEFQQFFADYQRVFVKDQTTV